MAAALGDTDIDARLAQSDWARDGRQITRELSFPDFATALGFVDRVGAAAEAANHHPDIFLHDWNKVRLDLSTHSEGGLTDADFALAAQIDQLA
jgi:4a-hydroxytetrahydrobiopterin dehydratase